MLLGVLSGLGAAVLQSLAYILSRHYTHSREAATAGGQSGGGKGAGGTGLVVLVHLWLGVMAIVLLPFVWMPGVPWHRVLLPMIGSCCCVIGGQFGLTAAIRLAEPSRVSPLLSMKIFLPAALATLFGPPVGRSVARYLSGWQWLAVALCVIAGVSISRGGGPMRKAALFLIVGISVLFGCSDWCVGLVIAGLLTVPRITPLGASLLGESILYVFALVPAVAMLLAGVGQSRERKSFAWPDWRDSFPYAVTWFLAMVCLFLAFSEVGVVLGSILQCTRSFLTILLGAGLMMMGLEHIEPKQPRRVIVIRIAAGVLMSVGITTYILRDPPAIWRGLKGRHPHPSLTLTQ